MSRHLTEHSSPGQWRKSFIRIASAVIGIINVWIYPLTWLMISLSSMIRTVNFMNWSDYFMGFAEHAALKSKDSTQVGAVLISPEGAVILTAYNGPPRGVLDIEIRRQRPTKYLYAAHAEANLIAFAARHGIRTDGCSVVVTHAPCAACARTLIQAGIRRISWGDGRTSMDPEEFRAARAMCYEAGVRLTNAVLPGETE
jgi:dCMP deaminase